MARFPVKQSEVSPVVTPSREPLSGPMPRLPVATGAAGPGLEMARAGRDLGQAANDLGTVYAGQKKVSDVMQAHDSLISFVTDLQSKAQTATDPEAFKQDAQGMMDKAVMGLPNQQARDYFKLSAGHYLLQSVLGVQHKSLKNEVAGKVAGLQDNLSALTKSINQDPSPGNTQLLSRFGADLINDARNSGLVSPEAAETLHDHFERQIWVGSIERRALVDARGTLEDLAPASIGGKGVYDDKLTPLQITSVYNSITARINGENALNRLVQGQMKQAHTDMQERAYYDFSGQVLDAIDKGANPVHIFQQAQGAGLDPKYLNRLHQQVQQNVKTLINSTKADILKQLQLPADFDQMIARKEHLAGVDINKVQRYQDSMKRIRGYITGGMDPGIACLTELADIKDYQLKYPVTSLIPQNSQFPVQGFQGNGDDPHALDAYTEQVRKMLSEGAVTADYYTLVRHQVKARKDFLSVVARSRSTKATGGK
jgi:hypothetical protein